MTAAPAEAAVGAPDVEELALRGDLVAAAREADGVLETADDARARARAARVLAAVSAHRGLLARAAELHAWAATIDPAAPTAAGAVARIGSGAGLGGPVVDPTIPTARAAADVHTARGLDHSVRGGSGLALGELTRAASLLECSGRPTLLDDTPAALGALVALHRGEPEMGRPLLDRAVELDLGGAPARRRHRLLRAWTRMVAGDDRGARADLADALALPGPVEARDDLVAVGLEAGIARRAADTAHLLDLWSRGRAGVLRHPVDLFTLLPLGELLVVAARLGEGAWLAPHADAADALLDALDRPALWAAPWYFAGVLAAAAVTDHDRAAERAQRLAALDATEPRTRLLRDAAACWVSVLAGDVDPAATMTAALGLRDAGLAWEGARLVKEAAVRTADRKAISVLLNCARGLQAGTPQAPSAPALVTDEGPDDTADDDRISAEVEVLSEREREVAVLLLDGLTYRQIGERLFIAPKTVEHHVGRMRQRLGSQGRSALFSDLRAALRPTG